jgi:hypothetical protein
MKPIPRGWWPWTAAAGLSLSLHLGWFLLMDVESAPAYQRQIEMLPLRTMTIEDESSEWRELLAMYSPSTFALPSRAGFSRPLLEGAISLRPPVQPATEYAMLLERSELAGVQQDRMIVFPSLDSVRRRVPEFELMTGSADSQAPIPATRQAGVPSWQIIQAPPDRAIDHHALTAPAQGWGATPWLVECRIIVDADGWVRQVLLERRSPSAELNAHLVRQLHGWRWPAKSGAEPLHMQIILRYVPSQTFAEGNGS